MSADSRNPNFVEQGLTWYPENEGYLRKATIRLQMGANPAAGALGIGLETEAVIAQICIFGEHCITVIVNKVSRGVLLGRS